MKPLATSSWSSGQRGPKKAPKYLRYKRTHRSFCGYLSFTHYLNLVTYQSYYHFAYFFLPYFKNYQMISLDGITCQHLSYIKSHHDDSYLGLFHFFCIISYVNWMVSSPCGFLQWIGVKDSLSNGISNEYQKGLIFFLWIFLDFWPKENCPW